MEQQKIFAYEFIQGTLAFTVFSAATFLTSATTRTLRLNISEGTCTMTRNMGMTSVGRMSNVSLLH